MAPYGSAIKAWPSGQIMATPMITRRGGYPVRYAKPVASARLIASRIRLFTSPTVQQPVSIQASYRLWQTGCFPQDDRACEQVARLWAGASL